MALNDNKELSIMTTSKPTSEKAQMNIEFITAYRLNEAQFNAFESALNTPMPYNKKLRRLLSTPAPWEKHFSHKV